MGGAEVRFQPTATKSVSIEVFGDPGNSCAEVGTVRVCARSSAVADQVKEPHKFKYDFYVASVLQTAHPQAQQLEFIGSSTGEFVDHPESVNFHLKQDGETLGSASVMLLISCNCHVQLVAVADKKRYHKVALSGDTSFRVPFRSLADEVDILLAKEPFDINCDRSLWEKCEARLPNPSPEDPSLLFSSSSSNEVELELHLVPKPFSALTASLLPSKRSDPISLHTEDANDDGATEAHDRINVTVNYHSRYGRDKSLSCSVPVRFTPDFWSLLIAASIGALVGSLIPLVFRKHEAREWFRAAPAAILISVIAEGAAMAVVKQVQIFGFPMNPSEILPAAILGTLVGARGFKSADVLDRIFPPAATAQRDTGPPRGARQLVKSAASRRRSERSDSAEDPREIN